MKRSNWVLVIFIAYCMTMLVYIYVLPDDVKDSAIWKTVVIKELNEKKPVKVYAGYIGQEEVVPVEQNEEIVELLQQSRFFASNRVERGSAPTKMFVLHYDDGSTMAFKYRGAGIFEYQRPFLFEQSRMLIEQRQLGVWVEKYAAYTRLPH